MEVEDTNFYLQQELYWKVSERFWIKWEASLAVGLIIMKKNILRIYLYSSVSAIIQKI
jgi:hypothetical protein